MYLQKVISRNFFLLLKVNDENSRIRIRIRIHKSEAWIQIRILTKMSWIRNTVLKHINNFQTQQEIVDQKSVGLIREDLWSFLDLERLCLPDLLDGDDLAGGFLELPQLAQEVPEAGLCHHGVRRKDPHPVYFYK
jgi:hypothetical protein